MEELLDQMEAAAAAGLIYPALVTAVTIPDIFAALVSDGTTSAAKYRGWVVDYMDD